MKKIVLVPYDKYQRMLEAQSVKTPSAPKPTKRREDQMPYPPAGKRETVPHRKSDADKYQRILEAQSVKIPTAPKLMKKKKDHMPYPPHGKRDSSTHRKSEVDLDWISF